LVDMGVWDLHGLGPSQPRATRRQLVTNSMYWHINSAFIPISAMGSASVRNSCSIATAWVNSVRVGLSLQVRKEQASEVGVHALIATDKFIGECETGHEATLLKPEDWHKGTREKDALNCHHEGDEPLSEHWTTIGNPCEHPIGFLLDTRDGFHSVE
jgi:hypothetical protein